MPHTLLQLAAPADPDLAQALAQGLDTLIHTHLGKDRAVMSTAVQFIDPANWHVGGQSLAAHGRTAWHLSISITDETNTKADKARFLRETHAWLAARLPHAHEVSYIHLVDARAAAYGYGGRTQEWRHQQAGV